MDFISLHATLHIICMDGPHNYTNDEKYSEAAGLLYQALLNHADTRPQWVEIDGDVLYPVFNESVHDEALSLLKCVGGWTIRRRLEVPPVERTGHFSKWPSPYSNANQFGIVTRVPNDDMYPLEMDNRRPIFIGFDFLELIAWFDSIGLAHTRTTQSEPVANDDIGSKNERELTKWLRETWNQEGKPKGTVFFNSLKKYVNKTGSPIVEHYTTSKKGAGIRWNTGSAINSMAKKTIQNKPSIFEKESQ